MTLGAITGFSNDQIGNLHVENRVLMVSLRVEAPGAILLERA